MDTAHAYYQASESFEVPLLRRRTFAAAGDDQWEIRAAQALSDDLSRAHRKVTVSLLTKAEAEDEPGLSDYMSLVRTRDVERFRQVMEELKAEESIGLPAVSVAARELADVADRLGREPGQEDRRSGT